MRCLVVAVSLCAFATVGATEELEVDDGAIERVTGKLVGPDATFFVRYLAVVHGHDTSGLFQVELPARGVVTAASSNGRRLALRPADDVHVAMEALRARPGGPARQHAIAIHRYQGSKIDIDLAVPGKATVAIDLTMTAPTCFVRDMRYVAVPNEWARAIAPALRVKDPTSVDEACAEHDGRDMMWVGFATRELAQRPGGVDRIGGVSARVALGSKHVAKVELALAGRITDVPEDLATVILVDASRSLSAPMRETQRELVASYLRGAPRSQVQVIAYDRAARALLPSWTVATQATTRIDRELRGLAPRNGSNVDLALRDAGAWLARTTGTRRIVVLGDDLFPGRLDETFVAGLRAALPAKTLVHVVSLTTEDSALDRDDNATLGLLAAGTRGLALQGGKQALDATMLVRPIAFERVVLKTPGWKALELGVHCEGAPDAPTTYHEGSSCVWYGEGSAIAGPIVFEGDLWNERVVRVLRPDLGRARELARELSAREVILGETANDNATYNRLIDRIAQAVNSEWSLHVAWGGRAGYGDSGRFGFGRSGFGPGCCGHGRVVPKVRVGALGSAGTLHEQLARVIATCKPDRPVRAHVGLTLEEVVDVSVTADSAGLRTCVEEAIWDAWLVAPGASRRQVLVVES